MQSLQTSGIGFEYVVQEHKLSVMDYFSNQYGYRAQFQFMPCLNAKGKKSKQSEYYPLELAHIVPNQPVSAKYTQTVFPIQIGLSDIVIVEAAMSV